MRDKKILIKLIELITIIILYYISNNNSLFLYAITLCLYNIYLSCFKHITLKKIYQKINYDYSKFKILKYTSISIIIISLLFIPLSIFISDITNIFLGIENTFFPYLIMSLSVMTNPLMNILLEYLESYNKRELSNKLFDLYYILESCFMIIVGIITINIIKLPIYISVSLLYLSKILSFVIILFITSIHLNKLKISVIKKREEKTINYKMEIKSILKDNSHQSIISLAKYSYYYISIIIVYFVLKTHYSYNIEIIEKDLTFVYLYGLYFINFIVDIILLVTKYFNKSENIINYICIVFQNTLTITLIISLTSSLICKIIFNESSYAIYLMMLSFLSIFIALYNTTYDYIKSKKIIYISLIVSIISKIILTIPFIDSFYRMGYNLIYGDIISTIISMSLGIIINYVYIKLNNKTAKTLENILTILYESILLCILLVIMQFIIPIKTDSYFKSILLLFVYIFISVVFIKMIKTKRRKRG